MHNSKESHITFGKENNLESPAFFHVNRKRIDAASYGDFEKELTLAFKDTKAKTLVLDLEKVDYIGTNGWTKILALKRKCDKELEGRRVVLVDLTPQVAESFEILNFSTLFTVYSSKK